MAELRKIGVLSVMKIMFVVNLLLGFLVGLFVTLASLVLSPLSGTGTDGGMGGMMFGPIAIVLMPLLYGVFGALMAGLGALVYNLLAARLGGMQVLILFPVQNR